MIFWGGFMISGFVNPYFSSGGKPHFNKLLLLKHTVASLITISVFSSPPAAWSEPLDPSQSYYSEQVLACNFSSCPKYMLEEGFGEPSGGEHVRVRKDGEYHKLLVCYWQQKDLAEKNGFRLNKRFKEAFVTTAKYDPHKLVKKSWGEHGEQIAGETSVSEASQLEEGEQISVYNELGYMYADEAEYTRAAEAWAKSLALKYDPVIALRLGSMQRLLEQLDEARSTLEAIDPTVLPPALQAERLDELAKIYQKEDKYEEAIDALTQANAIELTANRHYLLGLVYKDMGRYEDAINHLREAVDLDPENNSYAVALGYAYKDKNNFKETYPLFEAVLKRDPDYLKLYEDLGYTHMNLVHNKQAVKWFKRTVDNEPLYPVHSEKEQEELDRKMNRIRKEITKIDNRYDFAIYQTFRTNKRELFTTPGGFVGTGIIPSQGGAEFSYQPPVLGFRNERIFQVFARLLWNTKVRSLTFEEGSFQGGVGVRYKPLRTQNLFLSVERLFKIGDDAINSFLLRALYSLNYGFDLQPGRTYWNYTFLYGDLGYLVEESEVVFYGAVRQGITYNLLSTLLITPHLVVEGRVQEPSGPTNSYIEGGVGISLKYLFNETRYTIPRSNFELFIQYKVGRFIRETSNLQDKTFDGLVITGVFQF